MALISYYMWYNANILVILCHRSTYLAFSILLFTTPRGEEKPEMDLHIKSRAHPDSRTIKSLTN